MTLPPSCMTGLTTSCTVSFWLRIKTWNTSYATFFQAGKGSSPWAHYVFGFLRNSSNSTICFTISDSASTSSHANYLTSALSLNTWYHVVLAYETGKIKIYLNGSIDHQYTTTIVPHFTGITKITLGTCNAISSYQTDCDMNDLRIYDHTLNEDEVKRIYSCKIMDIVATNYNNGFFYDNSGILINKLVSTAVTYSGGSMYFNGSTSQIRPKDNSSGLNISGGTLSIWFTPLSKPTDNRVIYFDSVSKMALGFYNSGNNFIIASNGDAKSTYSTENIVYGNLNNVIISYNQSYTPEYCLINGISATTSSNNVWEGTYGLIIGSRTNVHFNGYISKVTVYRNQLTEDEAKNLYSIEQNFINEHLEYTKPYLTFTALEPNSTVQLNHIGTATTLSNAVLQYSVDGGKTWNDYTFTKQGKNGYSGITITLSNVFDSVKFKGINSRLGLNYYNYYNFKMSGKISAKGDVTSLLNGKGGDVNMTAYCYKSMFEGCTSLTTAPELPATSLAESCYYYMFNGCTSLTTAPELPATTLANYCYQSMFYGCTSLTTAPELPATTLANDCYPYMFYGCTNLNYIKALFKTTPRDIYTGYWVYGVSPTGTFIKNSSSTWLSYGYSTIPRGWTIYDESGQQIFIEGIDYDDSLNIYHIIVDDFRNESGEYEDITTEEYINNIYFNSDCYVNTYFCIGTLLYEGNTYYIWENEASDDYGYLLTTYYEFTYEDTIRYNHNNRNCVVWGCLDKDLNGVYTGNDLNENAFLLFDYWVDE